MRRNKRNNRTECGKEWGKNMDMSPEVFAMRRKVMEYLYEAKALLRANGIEMPRVEVRIAKSTKFAGLGRLGGNIIWIEPSTLKYSELKIRHIVFHEIVHAVTGFMHDDDCPLMHPKFPHKIESMKEMNEAFLKYFQDEKKAVLIPA